MSYLLVRPVLDLEKRVLRAAVGQRHASRRGGHPAVLQETPDTTNEQTGVKRSTGHAHTHTTAEHTTAEQTTHTNTEQATAQRRLIVQVVAAAPKNKQV